MTSPDIILPPKKSIIVDATIFNTFLSCERLVDLRFNHNFMSMHGKSNSLEIGSTAHKILEVYYINMIGGQGRNNSIANALVAGQMYIRGCEYCKDFQPTESLKKPPCGHIPNEYPGLMNTPAESETKPKKRVGYNWVLKTMEQYFDYYKNESWTPLHAEKVVGKVLYEDDEIRILWKAKIDVSMDTGQGIFPVDHKTAAQDRETLNLNNQFIGQCLVSETRSVIVNKIGWQKSKEPAEKFKRVVMNYSADRLLEWQEHTLPHHVYNLLSCAETGYYPPRFTHCENKYGHCQFKLVCNSDRNMREQELRQNFLIGEKWDPTNTGNEETT